eukprot:scaffold1008_cov96-Isochrysis_galbana.AAC.1
MDDVRKRPRAGGDEVHPVPKRACPNGGTDSRAAKGAPAHPAERLPAAISSQPEVKVEPLLSTDSGASTPFAEPPGKMPAAKGKGPAAGAKRKPGRGKQAAMAGNGHAAGSCGHQLQEARTTRGAVPGLAEAAPTVAAAVAAAGGIRDRTSGDGAAQAGSSSGMSSEEALALLRSHRVAPFLPAALAREIDEIIRELRAEAKEEAEAKRARLAAQAHAHGASGGGGGGGGGGGSGGGGGRLSPHADVPQMDIWPGMTAAARWCVLGETAGADASRSRHPAAASHNQPAHSSGTVGPGVRGVAGGGGTGGAEVAGAGDSCVSSSMACIPSADWSCRANGASAAPELESAAPELDLAAPESGSAAPEWSSAAPDLVSAASDLGCRGPLVAALQRLRDTEGGGWVRLGWDGIAARLQGALHDQLPPSPPCIVPGGGGGAAERWTKSRVCALQLAGRAAAVAARVHARLGVAWGEMMRRAVRAYNLAEPVRGQGVALSAALQGVYATRRYRDYC